MKESLLLSGTRLLFAGYFLFIFFILYSGRGAQTDLTVSWFIYLLLLYGVAEQLYTIFRQKGIDLTFAFPLLFAIYAMNLVSMFYQAQEKFPLLNRAEHFASFVFLTYIVWTFFIYYLPTTVWREHMYYTAILVLAVTALAGVFNEIIELALDSLFATRLIGDRFDTPLDLLMNTLGSGMFLAVRLILGSRQ